jgi:PIN like domain
VTQPARPATVRFYFDADILGLGKTLARLRPDITYPGDPGDTIHKRARPACPITKTSTPDEDWIPEVARRGWLIITRDSRIQEHRAEVAAVRDNGARMIALASRDAGGTWAQLEIFFTQWRRIEATLDEPGPFIYTASRTAPLRAVNLGTLPSWGSDHKSAC